ncbi:hypothetical protein AGMMS50267_06540 [Spirochaetia bacterium]|nr:hypothetical protein AGMMS50267_06520 [Spirochaetia bacterium]GHV88294.1 hypothetical protein AGMMS50267_06540 [Spirochaetia bacterium]
MQKKLFLMGMFSPAMSTAATVIAAMVIAVLAFGVVVTGCEGPAGPAGANGNDGTSIIWKGTLAAAPVNPVTNWAYYNTADKKAYIYDGAAWQILAVDGDKGDTGNTGATGAKGDKGDTGDTGAAGTGIVWKGSLATAPANPVTNWAYYNTADKKAYIYDGTTWQILAVDGRDAFTFTTPATYQTMVSLAGGTITGSGTEGVFPAARPSVTINPFKIAKYETTYQLWKEVYDWAVVNGYTIANPGVEGHGTDGTGTVGTAAERATRPVTTINWRDAIVWCNAYSQLCGKEPVYYTDTAYTTVLKESTNTSGTATAADTAVMKPGTNGYRLPTEVEWEYAARGGDLTDTTNWSYPYSGSSTVGDVAWYTVNSYDLTSSDNDYGVHPVGDRKAANGKELYDMSGNVYEWCWDWSGTISTATPDEGADSGVVRVFRGGCWGISALVCSVSYRFTRGPDYGSIYIGFRVVCP